MVLDQIDGKCEAEQQKQFKYRKFKGLIQEFGS